MGQRGSWAMVLVGQEYWLGSGWPDRVGEFRTTPKWAKKDSNKNKKENNNNNNKINQK